MDTTIQKIITPIAKAEIEIKDWITGGDAEYIDEVLYKGLDIKPEMHGRPSFGKFDARVVNEQTHREIEKFIVSVNGIKEKVTEAILTLPEDDYEFIQAEINNRRKKKIKIADGTPAQ
jgi:hypothetical protein